MNSNLSTTRKPPPCGWARASVPHSFGIGRLETREARGREIYQTISRYIQNASSPHPSIQPSGVSVCTRHTAH